MYKFFIIFFIWTFGLYANNIDQARDMFEKKDYAQAFSLYKNIADTQNNAEAIFQVGYMYSHGLGTNSDSKQAINYYENAANLGYGDAYYNLAVAYSKGELVPKDGEKAFHYYLQASQTVKEAKEFIDFIEKKRDGLTLQKNACQNECVLTYLLAEIKITDESIYYLLNKGLNYHTVNDFFSHGVTDITIMENWLEKINSEKYDYQNRENIFKYIDAGFETPEKALMYEKLKTSGYIALVVLIILGIFLGAGENRKIVVFKNYDDLGLTFLVPASFVLLSILIPIGSEYLGIKIENLQLIIASIVSGLILIKVVMVTYHANQSMLKTFVALLVKFPLAIIWIIALIGVISPSGKNEDERRKNRQSSLIILTLLTPIVGLLVVDKTGIFSPKTMLNGKRVGTNIRNNL
jgi:tetratricopeptide (TPR) repeat protein